ncbi:MAG: hypothetical protein AAB037_01355 [Chloroflexota bacterium]
MRYEMQIKHNPDYTDGGEAPRFFLHVDLRSLLPNPVNSCAGVHWRPTPGHPTFKELYWVEIAGKRLEKGNVQSLLKSVSEYIDSLVRFGTFPYYYLTCPGGEALPIYHSEGKFRLKMDGMVISGHEVGDVRQQVVDRLVLKKRSYSPEEVEVHLVLWQDLRLYHSAFVLRHPKWWFPIFYKAETGGLIYDVAGVPSRFLGLKEAFALRLQMAQTLVSCRLAASPCEVFIDQVQPQVWSFLEKEIKPTGLSVNFSQEGVPIQMPIYEIGAEVFAVEGKGNRRLIFSADPDSLLRQLSQILVQREKPIHSSATIEKVMVK